MKTILIFNDHNAGTENAAEFAYKIAQKVKGEILILNLHQQEEVSVSRELVIVGADTPPAAGAKRFGLAAHLNDLVLTDGDFKPPVFEISVNGYSAASIAELVIRKCIWMIVKGIATQRAAQDEAETVSVQAILNRVHCPVLRVPEKYTYHDFESITYLVDMRYCRLFVAKYLAEFAEAYHAELIIAHLSAKGLPSLDQAYAMSLYQQEIADKIHYSMLCFNNIKERNLNTAVDVLMNGLHTELFAMVNHRFHFEEFFGQGITDVMPVQLTVPVLIFPS